MSTGIASPTLSALFLFGLAYGPAFAQVQSVRLWGLGKEPAKLLLLNVKGPECTGAAVVPVRNGDASVPIGNAFDAGCGCSNQARLPVLAVFARTKAAALMEDRILCRSSLPGVVDTLEVELRPRRAVRVDVWTYSEALLQRAQDEMVNLDWILDVNLAGLTIDAHFHPLVLEADLKGRELCGKDFNAPQAQPPYNRGSINLYYGASRNTNCASGPHQIVMVHDVPTLGDVAHELGHRLGLNRHDLPKEKNEGGHTTSRAPFDCNNIMWQESTVLKNSTSLAQSFWMNFSCSSSVAGRSPCYRCGLESSACPNFATDPQVAPEITGSCGACTVKSAMEILARAGRSNEFSPNLIGSRTSKFCSRDEVRTDLRRRFDLLSKHARDNKLKMGSQSAVQMEMRWLPNIAVILTLEGIHDEVARDSSKMKDGLAAIDSLIKETPNSAYLKYARGLIEHNVYNPRCESEPPRQPQ